MTQNIKNALGVAITAAVLMVGAAAMQYSNAFGKSIQPTSFRSYSVSAEGKVVAVPDVATFSFEVRTEGGKDLSSLQSQSAEKVNKAIAFAKENGIDSKDMRTTAYSITPRYQYYSCTTPVASPSEVAPRPCPPPDIVGYALSQSVAVKVRDFKKVGDILAGVVQSGANSVSDLSFTIDDPAKVKNEAREKAIKEAMEKADAIAKAGGFSRGRLLGIDEGGGYYPSYDMGGVMKSAAISEAPVIEPGSQEVNVSVTMRYEIE